MAVVVFLVGMALAILWGQFYLTGPTGRHTSWNPGVFSLMWFLLAVTMLFGGYVGMAA